MDGGCAERDLNDTAGASEPVRQVSLVYNIDGNLHFLNWWSGLIGGDVMGKAREEQLRWKLEPISFVCEASDDANRGLLGLMWMNQLFQSIVIY